MKRMLVLLVLMPLAGCAEFDDFTAFRERPMGSPCAAQAVAAPACGVSGVVQTSATFPAQTAEPPR